MEYLHHFVTIFGMALCAILGFVVYLSNSHRNTNQAFAVLSGLLCCWLLFRELALLHFEDIRPAIFEAMSSSSVRFWMLHTMAAAMLVHPLVQTIQLTYTHPEDSYFRILFRARYFMIAGITMYGLMLSGLLVDEIILTGAYPRPVINTLGRICSLTYFLGAISIIAFTFYRSLRAAKGLQAFELHFMLLGTVSGLLFGCITSFILPAIPLLNAFPASTLTPLASIIFGAFVAYGIVTRKIMDVKWVIRNLFAHGIVLACAIAIYLAVFLSVQRVSEPGSNWPSMMASAITVLAMMPLIGTTGRLANQLFINSTVLDYNALLSQADDFMKSINTTEDLLNQFAEFVTSRFTSEHIQIFEKHKTGFIKTYPINVSESPTYLGNESPVCITLEADNESIDRQLLERSRPSSGMQALKAELATYNAQLALSISSSEGMNGIMFIGPKESGRIYTTKERETLQLLFNRLGTALRNAKLYTEAENSRIYNDILLYSLVNGVVAISNEKTITVCNKEARRLLNATDMALVGKPLTELPPEIVSILNKTIDESIGVRDLEMTLDIFENDDGRESRVRASSSSFKSQDGETIGALLILHDVTEMKKLEKQIRQNDRLASIGTLSAGMAHEIKNPLVSIKTFAQLLPDRYQDEEFRDTFSSIMEGEISRIDTIVNQLLSFARPSKPCLTPMPLHFVIERTLMLVSQQLKQNNVHCETDFTIDNDTIMGDANQLEQVFLNLVLNANESMPDGGKLTIKTQRIDHANKWTPEELVQSKIRILIIDSGEGIPPEKQSHIFDPFFTTKSTGTGLGLSVSHGILEEHDCEILVESEVGKGTTFHLTFDLIAKEVVV